MAKSILYSIHTTLANPYDAFQIPNTDLRLTETKTGSDGTIDSAWTALNATDGTGGLVDTNLVHHAQLIVSGVVTDTYDIDTKYDLAASVATVFEDSVADPVSGFVILP